MTASVAAADHRQQRACYIRLISLISTAIFASDGWRQIGQHSTYPLTTSVAGRLTNPSVALRQRLLLLQLLLLLLQQSTNDDCWFYRTVVISLHIHTIHKHLYSAKIVKRIWGAGTGWLEQKRTGRGETLDVRRLIICSTERMCSGSEFQVDGAETENAREVKLLVMPEGLAWRFMLKECKALDGRQWMISSGR